MMFDKLFGNPGCKVISLAKIMFVAMLVLCGILLILSIFTGLFLEALILVSICLVSAYIGGLMISVIGEITLATLENRRINAEILQELKKISATSVLVPAARAESLKEVKQEEAEEKIIQEEKPVIVKEIKTQSHQPVNDDLTKALTYALRFSTDEGIRGYIEAKRGQTNDMKEVAVYDTLLLNPNNCLRAAIETYLAEE